MATAPPLSVSVECVNASNFARVEAGNGWYDCSVLSCSWKAPMALTGTLNPPYGSSFYSRRQRRSCRHEYQKASTSRLPRTRVLPSSLSLADVAATATANVSKPVDISVLVQTSALLLFMYLVTNFVVPKIIMGKFDEEKEKNS